MNRVTLLILAMAGLFLCGCRQPIINRTDRAVYGLIQARQRAALGLVSSARTVDETGEITSAEPMYRFVPGALDPKLPDAFQTPTASTGGPETADPEADDDKDIRSHIEASPPIQTEDEPASIEELSPDIFTHQERERGVTLFGLRDALAYATAHARELQDAKEDLYLAALDLTLERHLWTPQFVASIEGEFADYGQVRDFDRAMTTVSEVSVAQRLPYGGEVTARVMNSLMRDLGAHVTSGESGSMILDASIPLFRGAGRVAYESRYQAERDLVYAVRSYERFRRSFLVRVAGDYFSLQQLKASIRNAHMSYLSRKTSWEKEDFINQLGQSKNVFDALRAKASFRDAEASLVSAKERYESALDRFKIFITMPVDGLLDVVAQDDDVESQTLERLLPDITQEGAVNVALVCRLDLLNSFDQVDDARRSVLIAQNRVLPDLDLSGSVTMGTDPDQKNSLSYNTERTTWRGFVNLRMDDRKTERNAYRKALITLRRAERDHEERIDTVRADVRGALRRVAQQADLRLIQMFTVEENELRWQAADAQNRLGKISNQDVVDAEESLLAARNSYAAALAAFRNAILEFRRDTGTLRITDDGWWEPPGRSTALAPEPRP